MNTNNYMPDGLSPSTPPESGLWVRIKEYLHQLLDLTGDKENERMAIEALKEGVSFRGANLWVLIFAILIASLGLNVNSTAVIIGAMLISPLMGPIIGFGLGLGISDFDLIKKAARNLAVMTLISLFTATIYFILSPLNQAQSELLARTSPTIYDVAIAFVGGAAGILANTTRNKSSVIVGVAIATALMPPLCTAGYGLAHLEWSYFFGALYLYLINSIFIGLATFIMVRVLQFPRVKVADPAQERKISRWMFVLSFLIIAPSTYFGYKLVMKSIAEEGAVRFVQEQIARADNQVIQQSISFETNSLEVVLLGEELSAKYIDSVRMLMPGYGLSGIDLVVRQGFGSSSEDDMATLRTTVLKDLYESSDKIIHTQRATIDSLRTELALRDRISQIGADVYREAQSIFPSVTNLQFAPITASADGASVAGREAIVIVHTPRQFSAGDEERLSQWLAQRLKVEQVSLLFRRSHLGSNASQSAQ